MYHARKLLIQKGESICRGCCPVGTRSQNLATSARSISITPSPPEIPFHVDVGRIWSGAQTLLHLSCPEGTYPAGESVLEMNSQMLSSSRFSKQLCYNADFPPRNDLQPHFSHMTQFPVRVSVRQRHRVPER
ncbi:predicted protein [Coccidioides posadasii str. Silveira]|uniref:Predicted protein n=1 Tax=Coccidioides posadasii (strain RMSCC 757 / Silveira) TaxID=443226 RepID=E9CSE5_COCPS|nr:predicted protein [Coccidioides posadasii str. Silveira]